MESVTCRGVPSAGLEQVKPRLPHLPLKRAGFVIPLPKTQQQNQVSLFVFAGNVRGMMDLAGKVNNLLSCRATLRMCSHYLEDLSLVTFDLTGFGDCSIFSLCFGPPAVYFC